ncbi:MAG: flagellar motor switch protein FliM [Candidatus Poribacteria bacterium]|nr:flagellar motor switch protein FliM [Candidatus Poribacteria bacterium]
MPEDEQVLSQDEVNALLDAVNTGDIDPAVDSPAAKQPAIPSRRYKKYDFSGPGIISKDHTRAMNMLHQQFVRRFSTSLSSLMRTLADVECDTVEQLTYSDFIMSLSDPSCLCKLSMHPLRGSVVMEISPDLVFPTIERLLGGRGSQSVPRRAMTEIEKEIMKQLIELIIRDLGTIWQRAKEDIRFELEGIETEPDYVQIVSPSDTVMLVILSVKFPPVTGMISICYPFTMIELAFSEARSDEWLFAADGTATGKEQEYRPRIQQNIDRMHVLLRAVFPATKIPLRELVKLEVGHVLELDVRVQNRKIIDPIIVEVAHKPRLIGKWGRSGRRHAVKIISAIDEDNLNRG